MSRAGLTEAERAIFERGWEEGRREGEAKALVVLAAVIEGAGGTVRVPRRWLAEPRTTLTRWTDVATDEEVFHVS